MNQSRKVKEYNSILLRWITWLPAIIIMFLIFLFSAKPAVESEATSTPLARALLNAFELMFGTIEKANQQSALDTASFFIRKAAHITEYLLLAVSISWPLWKRGLEGKKLVITSFLFSVMYAATDEFHQLFVKGRSGSFKDVGIDSIGCLLGALLFYVVAKLFKKRVAKRSW